MTRLAKFFHIVALLLFAARFTQAACVPRDSPPQGNRDALARFLEVQERCPLKAEDFRNSLEQSGLRLETTMVNFLGFHNPSSGAFFLFEIVSGKLPGSNAAIERGDLLFGHFLARNGQSLVLNTASPLVIEAIAWDPVKQMFNFYELVKSPGPAWFYRGDSKLVLEDIQFLYRQRTAGQQAFRGQLRCSGCHVNGGLIQKELAPPHNDWWMTSRLLLPKDGLKPDPVVSKILPNLVDATELSNLVRASSRRLAASPEYRKVLQSRSMQEQLRPLFCPVELNIESDIPPFDERKEAFQIPTAFFADPRLGTANIAVPRNNYDQVLVQFKSRIPASKARNDADHAWLAPVKANSDMLLTEALVEMGIIDNEFVADVLAVDFTTPMFSQARCDLLKQVPAEGGPGFLARLQSALKASAQPAAKMLLANLTDPKRNAEFHRQQVRAFLDACNQRATRPEAVNEWFGLLVKRRAEIDKLEFSRHPEGRILESPERVVFPSASVPNRELEMTASCEVRAR